MPLPSTIDEFLELIRKSGVAEEKRLAAHLEKLRSTGAFPSDPNSLAGILVRDGLLTHFQAEQLLQGKWRRFSIGKYKVLERIGAGGMGSVYLCEHKLMRRRVALKVLPTAKAEDPSALERFYREARAVAALDHPNIVRAYDIDQEDKLHFLVMEHVDGSNLQEIIKKSGAMDVLRACHYIRQAALGLQHAHEAAGLVHRDIKPGNVLVDRNGIVKILDMGLARFFHDKDDILTQKYDENVLGTADYLAPEQALDSHSVDIRADIYSLGATFYFCLTGRTPFAEGTVAQKLIWHQTRQPKPLRSFRPEVPEEIVAIIEKMMAKDVNQRYQTPQQVADVLAPYTQTPIPPPPSEEMPQFSPAAMGPETGAPTRTSMPVSALSPPPAPRKSWQVPEPSPPAPAALSAGPPSPSMPEGPRRRGSSQGAPPAGSTPVAPRRDNVPAERPPSGSEPGTPPRVSGRAQREGGTAGGIAASLKATPGPANGQVQTAPSSDWDRFDSPDGNGPGATAPARARLGRQSKLALALRSPTVWLIAGLATAIGLAVILIIWLALRSESPSRRSRLPDRPTIYVSTSSTRPDAVKNLADAIGQVPQRSSVGARIILQQDVTETITIDNLSNVSIESDEDHRYTWRAPQPRPNPPNKLLGVYNAENFYLARINLEGEDRIDALVSLSGKCPGSRLDNLTLAGFKKYGIWFTNCLGEPAPRSVILSGLTFNPQRPEQVDLFFDFSKSIAGTAPTNDWIDVEKTCKFGDKGTRILLASPEARGREVHLPAEVPNPGKQ
jgi:serine/threonine protein kinase